MREGGKADEVKNSRSSALVSIPSIHSGERRGAGGDKIAKFRGNLRAKDVSLLQGSALFIVTPRETMAI